jgi:aminopeptidase 2
MKQYNVILNAYLKGTTADERNTALRSLGRAKSPELIQKTLSLPLSEHVKGQDIYLPLGGLRTHSEGIVALWSWLQKNWPGLVEKLPPGLSMLGSVVSICTSSFTKEEQANEVRKFFGERKTKGFDQSLAQSLDAVRAKGKWVERDAKDVEGWLSKGGYL